MSLEEILAAKKATAPKPKPKAAPKAAPKKAAPQKAAGGKGGKGAKGKGGETNFVWAQPCPPCGRRLTPPPSRNF